MLRIISLNLNGIRSALKKGIFDWLAKEEADIVCVQELKAHIADIPAVARAPTFYTGYFHAAKKKGYSGVGIFARQEPDRVIEGFGNTEFDAEGRYIQADFGRLAVVSLYLPSGSSSEDRQLAKFRFLEQFQPHLEQLAAEAKAGQREVLLCGDWNIAHQEIDLKNWRSNQKNSGFLPEERAWLSKVFDDLGWIDVYRQLYPSTTSEAYTWWSNRGQAWANNVGWRIDYQIATPGLAKLAYRASIFKEQRFSDHAPLVVDYDWSLK